MYQPGTDPALMLPGWEGPNSQTGLTCANVPRSASVAQVNQNIVTDTGVITGRLRLAQQGQQRDHHDRQHRHVQPVGPRDDLVTGEVPAEDPQHQVRADDRDRQRDALEHAEAAAGQHVVREDGAGQARHHAQHQQRHPDQPVQPARPAERAGEVEPQQVRAHRRDEQQRRPVVHLPHQQPAAHVETDVQRRPVRLAHLDAVQLAVRAVVADLRHARLVVEQQEDAGDRGHRERVDRDLAEQRRPAVRPAPPVQPHQDALAARHLVSPFPVVIPVVRHDGAAPENVTPAGKLPRPAVAGSLAPPRQRPTPIPNTSAGSCGRPPARGSQRRKYSGADAASAAMMTGRAGRGPIRKARASAGTCCPGW